MPKSFRIAKSLALRYNFPNKKFSSPFECIGKTYIMRRHLRQIFCYLDSAGTASQSIDIAIKILQLKISQKRVDRPQSSTSRVPLKVYKKGIRCIVLSYMGPVCDDPCRTGYFPFCPTRGGRVIACFFIRLWKFVL